MVIISPGDTPPAFPVAPFVTPSATICAGVSLRTRRLFSSLKYTFAGTFHGDALRSIHRRQGGQAAVAAEARNSRSGDSGDTPGGCVHLSNPGIAGDEQIPRQVHDSHIDYSDIPPLTDEQLAATRDFGMRAEVGLEFVDRS